MNELANQRVLVTGAGGFLGGPVVRALQRRGATVRAHVGPPGTEAFFQSESPELYWSEITDSARLPQLVANVDTVVHLAGPPSVVASYSAAADYCRAHTLGTTMLLDACRQAAVQRFVYISSAEVYGRPQTNPVDENHRQEARSPYAAAKIGAERMVESFAFTWRLPAVILRPFSVYGPGGSSRSVFHTILEQASISDRIILANLAPIRDYCYVDDVADAVSAACSVALPLFTTLNVGSGKGTSVGQLAAAILQVLGRDLPIVEDMVRRRPEGSEIYELVADPRKAANELGWKARFSLPDGIQATVERTM
jgi:nucleoside-diphosphate-sugar epimerase